MTKTKFYTDCFRAAMAGPESCRCGAMAGPESCRFLVFQISI